MNLTHFGHACILLEKEGGSRILIDPGNLAMDLRSSPLPQAVLVTHNHEDHLDFDQLAKVVPDAGTEIYAPADTIGSLVTTGYTAVRDLTEAAAGVAGFTIAVVESPHEVIYPGIPVPDNYGLLIDGCVYHPGDSLQNPGTDVNVLLLPLGAPWLKVADIIDYVQLIAPAVVIPIHQGGLAQPHQVLHTMLVSKFAPAGTSVLTPAVGETIQL